MRKSDIVAAIADIADISSRQADDALAATLENITNALARGDNVTLVGFGTFTVKHRAARTGRNPQNGEAINIAASNLVSFKPGKVFKQSL